MEINIGENTGNMAMNRHGKGNEELIRDTAGKISNSKL